MQKADNSERWQDSWAGNTVADAGGSDLDEDLQHVLQKRLVDLVSLSLTLDVRKDSHPCTDLDLLIHVVCSTPRGESASACCGECYTCRCHGHVHKVGQALDAKRSLASLQTTQCLTTAAE